MAMAGCTGPPSMMKTSPTPARFWHLSWTQPTNERASNVSSAMRRDGPSLAFTPRGVSPWAGLALCLLCTLRSTGHRL